MKKIEKQFENVMFFVALVLEKAMVGWQLRLVFQRCFTILGEYSQVEISFIIGVYPWIIKHVYLAAATNESPLGLSDLRLQDRELARTLNREGALWNYEGLKIGLKLQKKIGSGNSNIVYVHPEPWGNDPIWRAYFSDGLKPPTRKQGPWSCSPKWSWVLHIE